MKKGLHVLPCLLAGAIILLLLYSCASMGSPSGGPRDEDPPRFVWGNPAPGSVNVRGNRLEIEFDELVNIKDAFTSVVVSPPGASVPKVVSSGRKVYVNWDDTLRGNTTYTVDFGKSIIDVNESNPLGNFSYTFSTGPCIDTLMVSGIVLDAATLEPQKGMLVGVHRADAPDSAFRTLRFERASKTDDMGRFTIRGLKGIPYNIFALGDVNNDYRWDNPAEIIAFYPKPVTPYAEPGTASDTIYDLKTGAVDTVVGRSRTIFLPNNLLLSAFDAGYRQQYLVKYERPDSMRLSFIFNAPSRSLPSLSLPDYIPGDKWYVAEHSLKNDTVTYWLADNRLVHADTLRVALRYQRTGKDRTLDYVTDTLVMARPKVRVPRQPKRKTRKQAEQDSIEAEKKRWINIGTNLSGSFDVYAPLLIDVPEPLVALDTSMVRLEQNIDSVWHRLPMPPVMRDSAGNVRRYMVRPQLDYGCEYRLSIDSLAMRGLTGRYNKGYSQAFKVKKREDYATLTLRLTPDTVRGFVEVLNMSDIPLARRSVKDGVVVFPYLSPTDYYARFVAHADSLQEFSTGDYDLRRQPDDVYYYPRKLSLKRYDRSEQWDLNALPVDRQKPEEIKKNKPDTKQVVRRKNKKNTGQHAEEDEESDYFDVSRNPFDNNPRSGRRN